MAASSATAVKSYLETNSDWKAGDVGIPVFRDRAPDSESYPYLVVHEAITVVPEQRGDNGQGATAQEQVQVDVWEKWHENDDGTGPIAERYALAGDVARVLHGCQLSTAPQRVYGVRVVNRIRLTEVDNDLVHNAITIQLARTF